MPGKTLRASERSFSPFVFPQPSEKQFGETQVGVWVGRVDQQALLVIGGRFNEVGPGLFASVCAFERPPLILINFSEQFVGLIFLRVLS